MAIDPVIRLMAVGDIMLGDSSHFLGRGVGSMIRRHGPDHPFARVREILGRADIFLGNLESPLSATPGRNSWQKVYRGTPEAAKALLMARRNIMTLANNHTMEHGREVYEETRKILSNQGVDSLGFVFDDGSADMTLRWEDRGLTFSLVCDSLIPEVSGRIIDPEAVSRRLTGNLREDDADIRLVSLHWGDEFAPVPSLRQRDLGRALIDAGATAVLGHHPHVLQPVEEYGSGLIAYSLGNFLFDQDWTSGTRCGGILDLEFGVTGLVRWDFLPTEADGRGSLRMVDSPKGTEGHRAVWEDTVSPEAAYRALLTRESRRHRIMMKMELIRNFYRVSPDTLHFLLTKRKRDRQSGEKID